MKYCQCLCILLCGFGFLPSNVSMAQNTYLETIDRIVENLEMSDDEVVLDDTYEDLLRLAENPLNVNTCTREQLEQLFFLSPYQIENLLYYRYSYGDLYTVYELQLIDGFDEETIQFLLPFIYVRKSELQSEGITLQNAFRYGKNQVLLRTDCTIQKKKGYTHLATDAQRYVGNPLYTQFRYRFSSQYLSIGVSMEKDAGEPFDWHYNKGFDFYAPYLFISSLWKFKHIALGHYKLNFGQGLVLQSSQRFGKSSLFSNTIFKEGISKSASLDESLYFNGLATTIGHKKLEITAFYSNTPLDGTLEYDSNNLLGLSSIKTDGIHRTENDFVKKNVARQMVIGGNIQYHFPFLKLGITGFSYSLDKPSFPSSKPYAIYEFAGKHYSTASIDYRARFHQFNVAGEMAIDKNGAMATVHTLSFQPISRFGLVALYRYYQPEYSSIFGNGFSQSSSTNNEEGFFMGTELLPFRKWKLVSYLDVFSFPWLKYLVNTPSRGYQGFIQATYTPTRNTTFFCQYKSTSKQRNVLLEEMATPMVNPYTKNEWRFQIDTNPFKHLHCKTGMHSNEYASQLNHPTYGFLLYQDVGYEFSSIPLLLNARYALFDAINYDNRLYAYERDVLYAFSVPMYYGQGMRLYVNVVYKPFPQLTWYAKFAHTWYADRNEIGSEGETIYGNQKTDIRILVNWKF